MKDMYVCIYVYVYLGINTCMDLWNCMYACVCMYVCMYLIFTSPNSGISTPLRRVMVSLWLYVEAFGVWKWFRTSSRGGPVPRYNQLILKF
jgi:hypothetical protein